MACAWLLGLEVGLPGQMLLYIICSFIIKFKVKLLTFLVCHMVWEIYPYWHRPTVINLVQIHLLSNTSIVILKHHSSQLHHASGLFREGINSITVLFFFFCYILESLCFHPFNPEREQLCLFIFLYHLHDLIFPMVNTCAGMTLYVQNK